MEVKIRVDVEKIIDSITCSGIDVEVIVKSIITVDGKDIVVCSESITTTLWHGRSQEKYSELKSEVRERIEYCKSVAERVKSMLETLVADGFKLDI